MTGDPAPRLAIIVVAAGSGTRLGAGVPKAFAALGGQTILHHCLRGVFAVPGAQIVIVAPEGREADAAAIARGVPGARMDDVTVVAGGAERQDSVATGLAALTASIDTVLVHDAARALTPPAQLRAVADQVRPGTGILPALPVIDTIKRVDGTVVVEAVDRADLAAAQTPQGFARAELDAAYALAATTGITYTDDTALYAAAGHEVHCVEGSPMAFKITTAEDRQRAEHLLGGYPRIGVGTDVHAFSGDGTLWLAGLEWPGEPALSGHSDGDAVAHAIVDALLSAAGLGDIGQHFGTAQPEFAGAHADVFLARTRELVEAAGFQIGNVAVQFQGNRPRFSARRAEAEQALSAALGGAPVAVSATTTDGLGFAGRGEGIAATATAILVPRG